MTDAPSAQAPQPIVRVAVVEDDPAALERITAALEAAPDISVTASAPNTATGKTLIDKGGFDVLLCDLGLPRDLVDPPAPRDPAGLWLNSVSG